MSVTRPTEILDCALQPEVFQPGWGYGILVGDSSKVQIMNNRVLSAAQNKIEVKNGRDVLVRDNGIDCSQLRLLILHKYFPIITLCLY